MDLADVLIVLGLLVLVAGIALIEPRAGIVTLGVALLIVGLARAARRT